MRGRHLVTGLPTEIALRSEEVRDAIRAPLEEILRAIADTLEETPPELAGDLSRNGILLAGGGSLPQLITERTGITTVLADAPLTCVATGSGIALSTTTSSTPTPPAAACNHDPDQRADIPTVPVD